MATSCGLEMRHWTRHQWSSLLTMCVAHFCNAMCVSIQAPFYPSTAEAKGATSFEYGLVFGIFQLVVFLFSPVMGRLLPIVGLTQAFVVGIVTTALMCIAFGFLDYIEDGSTFIYSSLALRTVEALGYSAFMTSSFSMVAKLFPSTVGTIFSLVEMFFGFGMIVGPTVGGALYDVGGFILPFGVLGGILLLQALVSLFSLTHMSPERIDRGEFTYMRALSIPSVLLSAFAVFCASIGVGALQTTLQHRLNQFDLDPLDVGLVFMLWGSAYAIFNPFWGRLADSYVQPLVLITWGSVLMTLGFILVGPLLNYSLTVAAVAIGGVGLSAQLIGSFLEAHRAVKEHNFPDSVVTYCTVAGIWTSSFALGGCVGPLLSGFLLERVGFTWSTLLVVCCNGTVFVLSSLFVCVRDAAAAGRRLLTNSPARRPLINRLQNHSRYGAIDVSIPEANEEEEEEEAEKSNFATKRGEERVQVGGTVEDRESGYQSTALGPELVREPVLAEERESGHLSTASGPGVVREPVLAEERTSSHLSTASGPELSTATAPEVFRESVPADDGKSSSGPEVARELAPVEDENQAPVEDGNQAPVEDGNQAPVEDGNQAPVEDENPVYQHMELEPDRKPAPEAEIQTMAATEPELPAAHEFVSEVDCGSGQLSAQALVNQVPEAAGEPGVQSTAQEEESFQETRPAVDLTPNSKFRALWPFK